MSLPSFRIMGVKVHPLEIPEAVELARGWVEEHSRPRILCLTSMHEVVLAQRDPELKRILESADLNGADGTPIVLLARVAGHPMRRRLYGPELMLAFLEATGPRYRHFFYGGAPGVPERLAERLRARIPGLQVAGVYAPPFAPVAPREDPAVRDAILAGRPDVIWVGLGSPKQYRWVAARREELSVPLLVTVGAAFDFLSGRVAQAPPWVRERGLEWLFRLSQEPRRLAHRYLVLGGEFVVRLAIEGVAGRIERGPPRA